MLLSLINCMLIACLRVYKYLIEDEVEAIETKHEVGILFALCVKREIHVITRLNM